MLTRAMLAGAMALTAPIAAQVATPVAVPGTQAAQPAHDEAVAQAVERHFASYDRDGDGVLSPVEFTAWMVALKAETDPSASAESPATQRWIGAAFARADTNNNSALTMGELVGFLSAVRQG